MSLTGPKPGCWPRGHHTSLLALHVAQSQVSGSPELAPQPFLHAVPSQEMTVTWAVPHRAPRAVLPPAGPRAATSWAPRGLGRLERDVTHFFHPLSLFKRRCSHCLLLFERASPPHRHQVKADGTSGCFSEHVSEGGARCGSGPPSLCPSALPASSSPACDHCQACPFPVSNANLQLCSSESSAERPLLLVSCRAVLEPPRVWPLSCC